MDAHRVIVHVDMDHFYSAVEERRNPEYEGRPVIVGADPKGGKGRGVVSTCNYKAREFGVRSGMPISRAWKRCPNAVYLRPDFKLYGEVSSRIMAILRKYADKFERWGFDEAFLDISSRARNFVEAKEIAEAIRQEIYDEESLTCSVGVGPNKLVAKMASDFKKPDGLTIITDEAVQDFLAPLPVRKLLWVGKKTERRLNEIGIRTIGDLAAYDASVLTEKFGMMGAQYQLMARGIDESEVTERGEAKSVGREITYEEDTSDLDLILGTLLKLSESVHKVVVGLEMLFRTVTVRVRYENFETHTHGKTLPFFTDRLQSLQKTARELLEANLRQDRKLRLIGVRVSKLISRKEQTTLV
ncbi:MAG: DNA polymerase IV [Candidatus Bathyarchaeota archaeon]|nr:MAG: DNA polymerase IV [Candidatus Bathyarchaeota archaeon]